MSETEHPFAKSNSSTAHFPGFLQLLRPICLQNLARRLLLQMPVHRLSFTQEEPMAQFERIRDVISGPFNPSILQERTASGWQLVSIEWRRELPANEMPTQGAFNEDIPYGLRISDDCTRLEVDLRENQILIQMMDLLVQDFPFSSIASDLNEKGFRTRQDKMWTQVSIFNLLPRLIEVGPRLFSTEEWEARRHKFWKSV
jgi:hypothetical protein